MTCIAVKQKYLKLQGFELLDVRIVQSEKFIKIVVLIINTDRFIWKMLHRFLWWASKWASCMSKVESEKGLNASLFIYT